MSHKLAREWVAARLAELGQVRIYELESSATGTGVPFPEGADAPDFVEVCITLPRDFDDERIELLVSYLREAAEHDPRLEGRFASGGLQSTPRSTVETVNSADVGPEARRVTIPMTVTTPDASQLNET